MIKNSRFPLSLFGNYLGVLFLMSGIHVGLVLYGNTVQLSVILQILIPMAYWAAVAAGLTIFTRQKMEATYEQPMRELAEATEKVADGDFSVYVPTIHPSNRLDYLDLMILDFNKMVEELGSVETLKTDFVSNVSHEMKTPIAVIRNYAELLQMQDLTEEDRIKYALNISDVATKMANLISNILKLNKLENQTIDLEISAYDICGQLEECILQFEDQWDEKELDLQVDMEDRRIVYADKSLMELVWNNLLSNAVKFTEPGGTVAVRQAFSAGFAEVSVSDTGCGMSRESIRHIFDKFYQGDTSHSKEGNGLGLAMVKRILELMNGEISVISELGKGSTFTVRLPLETGRGEEEIPDQQKQR